MTRLDDSPTEDEYVEITCYGDRAPRYMLAVDGVEADISKARTLFLAERIGVDEFERRVGKALERKR